MAGGLVLVRPAVGACGIVDEHPVERGICHRLYGIEPLKRFVERIVGMLLQKIGEVRADGFERGGEFLDAGDTFAGRAPAVVGDRKLGAGAQDETVGQGTGDIHNVAHGHLLCCGDAGQRAENAGGGREKRQFAGERPPWRRRRIERRRKGDHVVRRTVCEIAAPAFVGGERKSEELFPALFERRRRRCIAAAAESVQQHAPVVIRTPGVFHEPFKHERVYVRGFRPEDEAAAERIFRQLRAAAFDKTVIETDVAPGGRVDEKPNV